ncbi:hypothetical protein [Ammoniphilus sp. CFH 90114]|uniref:hypothetical protein n=1 Tax=Ammoniphilus sp. CFH 90114 TaxID=2493665 RepID=UPI00100E7914|nr:hypothetical protein [Ammoniphilus sp. CFH 90114]RXT13577.1 hypothetical protein EIZ39_05340 [Ammoniphilus sp. CFH 90114]
MPIQIRGYDITSFDKNHEETDIFFAGIAHLEYNSKIADVGFEGRHEKGVTGFIDFDLKDPDQIDIPQVRARADEIRDVLAEHLLESGYEAGEYRDVLTLQDHS